MFNSIKGLVFARSIVQLYVERLAFHTVIQSPWWLLLHGSMASGYQESLPRRVVPY